ncbi:hypothetical protein D1641_14115 [Colidextribacter sp. OB.20]|uniref:DUF6809 family protein n=1 Tax=Colidextribacter sp. OB.20 TaxID=2304568 RepID=UPI00136B8CB8|nr:DUF6809 family protein [Colidextribacter sp. OB.20]NBI11136.1 hypothetical protein [Colidextribacter sp. OB.20]
MNDFIADLYYILTEEIQVPTGDPEYKRAVQAYMELEEEVKEKIGLDLLSQYQRAHYLAHSWEDVAAFSCGLRFGARFVLEVLH